MECQQCQTVEEYILLQKRKIIAMNKGYVKSFEDALKILEKLRKKKDKDRLDYAFLLLSMITLMKSSITGWTKWCDIAKMHALFENKEDIEKTVNEMTILVTKWIEMDIAITNVSIEKMEQETITNAVKSTKKKRKKKTPKTKTTMYVA